MQRDLGTYCTMASASGRAPGMTRPASFVEDLPALTDLRQRNVAPAVEAMLWHYAYGVPKQTVAVEATPAPIFATGCPPTARRCDRVVQFA
jgi:hypothetical protein